MPVHTFGVRWVNGAGDDVSGRHASVVGSYAFTSPRVPKSSTSVAAHTAIDIVWRLDATGASWSARHEFVFGSNASVCLSLPTPPMTITSWPVQTTDGSEPTPLGFGGNRTNPDCVDNTVGAIVVTGKGGGLVGDTTVDEPARVTMLVDG